MGKLHKISFLTKNTTCWSQYILKNRSIFSFGMKFLSIKALFRGANPIWSRK